MIMLFRESGNSDAKCRIKCILLRKYLDLLYSKRKMLITHTLTIRFDYYRFSKEKKLE